MNNWQYVLAVYLAGIATGMFLMLIIFFTGRVTQGSKKE